MRVLVVATVALASIVLTTALPSKGLNNTEDCESSEEESDEVALRRHEIARAQARAAAQARMVALGECLRNVYVQS